MVKNNRKKLNLAILRIHQMYNFYNKCIEYDKNKYNNDKYDNKEEEIFDIDNNKIRFNVAGIIFEPGEFLYILSMIKRQFPINEQTFFIFRHFLCNNYRLFSI